MRFESILTPRIVYMGTPEISASVLKVLLGKGLNIVGVITNPDKAKGRGATLEPTPVKSVALSHGIEVFQPISIKTDNAFLSSLRPDAILTMAYGQIVPEEVLSLPPHGCYNLHGSLLPSYRGAAPMQRAIINRERQI